MDSLFRHFFPSLWYQITIFPNYFRKFTIFLKGRREGRIAPTCYITTYVRRQAISLVVVVVEGHMAHVLAR